MANACRDDVVRKIIIVTGRKALRLGLNLFQRYRIACSSRTALFQSLLNRLRWRKLIRLVSSFVALKKTVCGIFLRLCLLLLERCAKTIGRIWVLSIVLICVKLGHIRFRFTLIGRLDIVSVYSCWV